MNGKEFPSRPVVLEFSMPVIQCVACKHRFVYMHVEQNPLMESVFFPMLQARIHFCPYCGVKQ